MSKRTPHPLEPAVPSDVEHDTPARTWIDGCLLAFLTLIWILILPGCARTRQPVPIEWAGQAEVVGYPDVRGWWERPDAIAATLNAAARQARPPAIRLAREASETAGFTEGYNILCLSGGGAGGAFGAGLLCGWSDSGRRPRFDLVTGVSAGAVLAPFAFLGPGHDPVLWRFRSEISTSRILKRRSLIAVTLGADSLADSAPLARLIEAYVTDEVVVAVARAHAQGRRLLIGTTNLDTGRLIVWDMGAIAASGRPDAPALFRKVILASASIPIVMPAQYFPVEAAGRACDEPHVDGGVVAEVFLYGVNLDAQALWDGMLPPDSPRPRLYVIRNGHLRTPSGATESRLIGLAERTVISFLDAKAAGDVYGLYALAQRDDLDFHLGFVPENIAPERREPFDPEAMRLLFEHGYNQARHGYSWHKAPPGLEAMTAPPPALASPAPADPPDPPLDMGCAPEPQAACFTRVCRSPGLQRPACLPRRPARRQWSAEHDTPRP